MFAAALARLEVSRQRALHVYRTSAHYAEVIASRNEYLAIDRIMKHLEALQ